MSSVIFDTAVTTIPAHWANDVNRVIYNVLGSPASLPALQLALGLGPVLNGGAFQVTGGSINSTPIGASAPSSGVFSSLRLLSTASNDDNVVSHAQLNAKVQTATAGLQSMSTQDASAVAITGGTINGAVIGGSNPVAGTFTTLKANDPVSGLDVVNIQTLNARMATLPTFGTISTQNANSVNLTGGAINGVVIGGTTPAQASFSNVNVPRIVGQTATLWLDGNAPSANEYGVLFDMTSLSSLDLGFKLQSGGTVVFSSPEGELTFSGGRLMVNTPDDGIHLLQVGGAAVIDELKVSMTTPVLANHVATKNYVDLIEAQVTALIAPAVNSALSVLGSLSTQNSATVSFTGGAIDGIHIGANAPSQGTFTQVNTNMVNGDFASILLDGTGGYANSALILNASSDLRPNISVVPNAGGAFTVMSGGQSVFRSNTAGRTIVGLGGDDGTNTLQVRGNAAVYGRLGLGGGVISGSVAPSLGSAAPALAGGGAPLWTRVRVETVNGTVECVIPAFPVL